MSRANAKLVQHRLHGRLKASLEPQRDVVLRFTCEVLGAGLVAEVALAVMMTASDVRADCDVN